MGEQEEESWFPPSSEDIGRHICTHIWLLEMSEIGMSQSESRVEINLATKVQILPTACHSPSPTLSS